MECIFCKIVRGEVPSRKVFENEHTMVFMDVAGDVDGHMLAVPKRHCSNILDCDEETLGDLMLTVKGVADHLVKDCGYDGVNLLNASGESAGQTVPHFHIHMIPRKSGDGVDAWPKFEGAKAPLDEVWQKIALPSMGVKRK